MTFHYRYRKQIIMVIVTILIMAGIVSTAIYFYEPPPTKKISSIKSQKPTNDIKKEEPLNKYMVDIKGEIINPGIYELTKDSRVIDVINKAGGLTNNADTTVINLSKKIVDEMVIIIYSKEQVNNWKETMEEQNYLQEKCTNQEDAQIKNDACIKIEDDSNNNSKIININIASKEELMTLTGIGETKAEAIIAYRNNTPFTKIEDIKNVSGIGDSVYEEIKNNITV